MTLDPSPRELRRALDQIPRDPPADGDHGVRAREPRALRREIRSHVRDHRQRQRPQGAGARLNADRHVAGGAGGAQREALARVQQIRPVADGPVVPHGGDGGHARGVRGVDRRHGRHHVLRVDDVEAVLRENRGQVAGERSRQLLALVVVPHVRDGRRRRAELEHAESIVGRLARARRGSRLRLHDRDVVSSRAQAAGQLVGAPAAAAADGRKRVSRDQDPHPPVFARRACVSEMAVSSALQWAAQL